MFVILAYDIGVKRVKKAHMISKKYLLSVQRSLFQGYITEKQLKKLKEELASVILPNCDKIIIYKIFNDKMMETDKIGLSASRDMIL